MINKTVTLNDITYTFLEEKNYPLMGTNVIKHAIVYENDTSLLLVCYGLDGDKLIPIHSEVSTKVNEADLHNKTADIKQSYENRILGKTAQVVLLGFNQDATIEAKIDTGATHCSINAKNISYSSDELGETNNVSFEFNGAKYTMDCLGKASVHSADGGIKYRPVVKFMVKLQTGQTLEDVTFNLNDREGMEYPVLLGLNFLERGKFLIDPVKEDIDWASIELVCEKTDVVEEDPKLVRLNAIIEEFKLQLREVL